MQKAHLVSALIALSCGIFLSQNAQATTVTINAMAPASDTATTFNAANAASGPGTWAFVDGAVTADTDLPANPQPNPGSICNDPLGGTGTTAYYVCVEAGGTAVVNFTNGITQLDILWGSPDGYNTLTFSTGLNMSGTSESFVPGQGPLMVNMAPPEAFVLFQADPGTVWHSVTFTSVFDSFEFADFETQTLVATSVPEPATTVPAMTGLIVLAAALVRRRKAQLRN